MMKMEGWRAGAFVVYALDTPGSEFRENSRERGARSPTNRSQRFDPPSRGTDFRRAKRESVPGRGSGRRAGREPGAQAGGAAPGRGRRGTWWAGWPGAGGKMAEHGVRAGLLGPQRGHVAAAAGLLRQPGKRAGRAAGANVGANLGGSRASRAVPNLPGPVCGQNAGKTGVEGRKRGRRGTGGAFFSARAGRGGRRFGKNTVIRRRKKLHKPRTVITDPGAGAGSRPRTRYISRPFSGRFSLSDKSYFSPE